MEKHSWTYLSLIGDERIINLQHTKVYVFSDSVLCLGKIQQHPESYKAWEQRLGWIISSQSYWNFDRIDGEPTEFEWNIFQRFDTLQLCDKVTAPLSDMGDTRKIHRNNSIYVDVQRHFLWNKRQWTRMFGKRSTRIFVCKNNWKKLWSFIGPGSEKKWYSMEGNSPQRFWDNLAEKDVDWIRQEADVQFSALRVHCPEVDSEAKDMENCRYSRYSMQPIWSRLRLFFA